MNQWATRSAEADRETVSSTVKKTKTEDERKRKLCYVSRSSRASWNFWQWISKSHNHRKRDRDRRGLTPQGHSSNPVKAALPQLPAGICTFGHFAVETDTMSAMENLTNHHILQYASYVVCETIIPTIPSWFQAYVNRSILIVKKQKEASRTLSLNVVAIRNGILCCNVYLVNCLASKWSTETFFPYIYQLWDWSANWFQQMLNTN